MKIRARAVLVIILTNLVIIIFSVSSGIVFVQKTMDISLETDLAAMAHIADHFLSVELDYLKLKASRAAESLELYDEAEWPEILLEQRNLYPEFIGMSVIDDFGRLIAASGDLHARPDLLTENNIKLAFPPVYGRSSMGRPTNTGSLGRSVITSTCPTDKGMVFYLTVPMLFSHDKILALTLSGMYFSQRLSNFVIWETGHIFMSDSEGFAIANPREHWIQNRFNYIQIADTDSDFASLAETVTLMTQGKTGSGYYSVDGVPRLCSYRPVSGSEEGWSLGVVVPLPESPVKNTDRGLIFVAFVSIILSVIAAMIASNLIKKPFERIALLKEEADAANKAKSSFLSTMSHEIRTPMNAILGISEIQLQKESLEPSVRDALLKIFNSGDLLLSIINDILDLSKIEAGKLELLIDKYEIASLISDTAQLNMMRIGSKPIKFELSIDKNLPAYLMGDELRIKQVLNNLLSNAFKYTKEGFVKLSIYMEPAGTGGLSADEVMIVFSVRDSGQGMTKEQISMIFDIYSQFNKKVNRSTEGTGLGMSITHNLISLMKGNIQIESEPDKGSTFTVSLPQGKYGSDILGTEAAWNLEQFNVRTRDSTDKVKMSRDPMPYGNILIVDDMEANIYVAKGLLALYEIKIQSSNSGISAIERVRNGEKYDIIFMDHMMPEMDGIEATKRIRDLGYTEPIVALSANAIEGQEAIFLHSGFNDFVSKPIDLRQLNLILNKYVRDKQPQEVVEEARRQRVKRNNNQNKQNPVDSTLMESFIQDAASAVTALESFSFEGQYSSVVSKLRDTLEALKTKQAGVIVGFGKAGSEAKDTAGLLTTAAQASEVNDGYPPKSLLQGREIAGLDITKGIQRFGDNEQAYLDVLHSYVATVNSILDDIESVNEETLDSYKIKVHGIKGTSFDIFAEEIAKEAKDLEMAAKSGDYEFIKKNNPFFIENTRYLIFDIKDMLKNLDSENPRPVKDKPDKEVLLKLINACNDYDMDGADEAIAELENYQYESDNDLIDWLRNNIDSMHFEEIAERLSELCKT